VLDQDSTQACPGGDKLENQNPFPNSKCPLPACQDGAGIDDVHSGIGRPARVNPTRLQPFNYRRHSIISPLGQAQVVEGVQLIGDLEINGVHHRGKPGGLNALRALTRHLMRSVGISSLSVFFG